MKKSFFTVDVEDGVSIAMRDVFNEQVSQTRRVVYTTNQILELLSKFNTKATFFTLGQVAETFPTLIKSIANEGHEISVHGYNHLQFFRMTPKQAKEELSRAKKILEDLSGQEIMGHRAPAFSVMPATAWALDIIAECGFRYDSSIIPIKGKRYGWPGFPEQPVILRTLKGNQLVELPISVTKIFGKSIPFSGGGYLRLYPFEFTKWAFQREIRKGVVNLYLHPYELDTDRYPDYYFQAMKTHSLPLQLKMRSNWIGRKGVYGKLEALLKRYDFGPINKFMSKNSDFQYLDLASISHSV